MIIELRLLMSLGGLFKRSRLLILKLGYTGAQDIIELRRIMSLGYLARLRL